MPQEHDTLPVGVVIEQRRIDNPWQAFRWHTVGIIPGAPRIDRWQELRRGTDWVQFHAGTLTLQLFGRETQGYMVNLANRAPSCYVVLRQGQEAEDHDVEPFLVTVCPFEAQGYLDAGEDTIDAVPMDDGMKGWVKAFCDRNHREEPFHKRKRRDLDDNRPGPRVRRVHGRQ